MIGGGTPPDTLGVLDAMPVAVAVADLRQADAPLVYVNAAFCELTGYPADEVLGRNCRFLQPPEADSHAVKAIARAVAAAEPWDTVLLNAARDGTRFWNALYLTPLRADDGTATHMVAVQRDVTARVRAERQNAAKTEFLANMSHEIRTPLNTVVGSASALRGDAMTPEQASRARAIEDAANMLAAIVRDVVDFAKLEAGQISVERHRFDPAHHLRQAAELKREEAEAKGLRFKVFIDTELPEAAVGDHNRLRQIVANYLSNAVKYTREGEVRLSAEVEAWQGETVWLDVGVADTGQGIPESRREQVFQRFTPLHEESEAGGFGLGLSICRGLAGAMGGRVGFESTEGRGSRFWVRLPLETVAADLGTDAARLPEDAGLDHSAAPPRVLLAEDVASNRQMMADLLGRMGISPVIACDGQEAVETAARQPFDLILLDLRMPRLDGLGAARRLGAGQPETPPVAVLTADVTREQRERAAAAGAAEVLDKPVTLQGLANAIARWTWHPSTPGGTSHSGSTTIARDGFLAAMAAEDGAKAARFAAQTRGDLDSRMAELDRALAAGDLTEAAELAHAMKSVAAQADGHELADALRALERACRDDARAATDAAERVRAALARFTSALRAWG